jgi:hypothetical protein
VGECLLLTHLLGDRYNVPASTGKLRLSVAGVNRCGAAMQQIEDWLKRLGMSEYAERFADNKIDVSVLPYLTDQDLKDIDILLSHRRKMLAAIAELSVATQPKPELAAGFELKPQEVAERRQVTVIFSDLVGSTALSARMDPEDIHRLAFSGRSRL